MSDMSRPERCIVTIASLDQWLATIEKHRYQWLADWKPLKNHWSQWLSRYHSINGNGHLKNHWFFAMVVNFLPLCLAEADIKQTNDSFWKIKNIFLQCLEQDVPWFMSTCVLVDFMPCLVSDKSSLTRILSRISFCEKRVTIVNHWSSKLEKPLKNHRCQWLSRYHSINGDGENFQKPSPFHRWRKPTIAIPSPWKFDHRSGLPWSLFRFFRSLVAMLARGQMGWF